MFQFWLERGDDETKHCKKIKQRQRARLGSIRRKRGKERRRDDVGWRRGGTMVGKGRR
jgi:hypothetical protein